MLTGMKAPTPKPRWSSQYGGLPLLLLVMLFVLFAVNVTRLPVYEGAGCKAEYLVFVYFVIGLALGGIPFTVGLRRKRPRTGIVGLACCLVASLTFGFLLTIPVCILFTLAARLKPPPQSDS